MCSHNVLGFFLSHYSNFSSVVKAIGILIAFQKNYLCFIESISDRKYSRYDKYEMENEIENARHYWTRLSLDKIAKQLKIEKKAAGAFIKRIGKWIPEKYSKDCYVESNWFAGLKNKNAMKIYTSLFNLLFDGDEPRSLEEILFTLVKKRIIDDWKFKNDNDY